MYIMFNQQDFSRPSNKLKKMFKIDLKVLNILKFDLTNYVFSFLF